MILARCVHFHSLLFCEAVVAFVVIIIIMYCIMSCNEAKNVGEKRPLEYQNEEAAFVVSQQDDDDDGAIMSSNKRRRTAEPESPGVVSITSAAVAMDLDVMNISSNDSKPWWKQKPLTTTRAPMIHNRNDKATCCFICKRLHPQEEPQSCGNMPCNSLLSYFPTTTRAASTGTMTAAMDTKPSVDTNNKNMFLRKCTFCDRAACPSCTCQCEECHFHFCSLCSTANYSGPYERSYCLDCNDTVAANRRDDTNDMNIG
jgi:hypothetical protein